MGPNSILNNRTIFHRLGGFEGAAHIILLLFILTMGSILLILIFPTTEGIAWQDEGKILDSREYRDIALTDLEDDGDIEVGGLLKEPGDHDPSVEFFMYSEGSWELRSGNITPAANYKDLALDGGLVAVGDLGGNGVNAWFYNSITHEFEKNDPESVIQNTTLSVAIADLDNDGCPDIVGGYKTRGIKIFYGTPAGGWRKGDFPKTSNMVKAVLVADLNNDTHLDIINTHKVWGGGPEDPKALEVWYGDGEGNWAKRTVYSDKSIDYSTIACADLNEDGYLDIIAGSDSKQGIDEYLYQPIGSYWNNRKISSKGSYASLRLENVDNDGRPDIVGCRYDDGGVNIFRGEGGGNFSDEDLGPVDTGSFRSAVVWDFDEDGHPDLLAGNGSGLYRWRQVLPEIKNVNFPEVMYAQHEHYNLSLEVESVSLLENPDNLEYVRLGIVQNDTTVFTLTYNGGSNVFYVEEGQDMVSLNGTNSSRENSGEGKVRVSFNVEFKWAIPDLSLENGAVVMAYMKESSGSTGWVEVQPQDWRIVSSISVGNLSVKDDTLNPGMSTELNGTIYYNSSDIPVPDDYISQVRLYMKGNEAPAGMANSTSNGQFLVNVTVPEKDRDYIFWPEVDLNRSEAYSFSFPETNVTVHSDLVMVTDIRIAGGSYYDHNTNTYWQGSGESLTFYIYAEYNHSKQFYEGELRLTNGTEIWSTTNRTLELTSHVQETLWLILSPVNDSAFNNSYGPMLDSSALVNPPRAVWDGEAPMILDFTPGNLRNGSEIKPVDAKVSIIVSEKGLMDKNRDRDFGGITTYWSIIRDVNTTINGSAEMNWTWKNENYIFSHYLPLSQAKTDDVVLFWFKGNDTVGNELLSALWPVECTEEDPATILVDPTPPSAPTNLSRKAGDGYVELRWEKNPEPDLAGYRIYRSIDGERYYLISGGELVRYIYFKDEGLENGKTYYYRITAVDRAVIPNESNFSETVKAKPEEKLSFKEKAASMVMDNLLIVFAAVVGAAIAGESVIVMRKSKGKMAKAGEKKLEAEEEKIKEKREVEIEAQGFAPPEIGAFAPPEIAAGPEAARQPQTTPLPIQPDLYPPIQGPCPECNKLIVLKEGERYCTNCGSLLR